MSKPQSRLSDQVRRAIAGSGLSRYAISKASGIDQAALSRFMAFKAGLTLTSLDALADVLGLDLVVRGPVRVPPPQKPGRKPKAQSGKAARTKKGGAS